MQFYYLTVINGLEARNLLELGVLERLLVDSDKGAVIVTPAFNDAILLRSVTSERVRVVAPCVPDLGGLRGFVNRQWKNARRAAARRAWALIEEMLYSPNLYAETFRRFPPCAVIINPRNFPDVSLGLAARRRHVPVLGVVPSWDNILKGLRVRSDWLAVWNPVNRDEAIQLEGVPPKRVEIVGPVQFDPYFAPDVIRPREEFLTSLGLDPARPVILFPTSATSLAGDQTSMLDTLLQASRDGRLDRSPQIVCRPYPRDSLWPYARYLHRADVHVDVNIDVNPVLGATMNVAQIRHMANLLAHSAVMVNYATTVTLEAAIFDTPTILLAYTDSDDADRIRHWIERKHFDKHFRGIVERDLAPVVRNECQLIDWINRFLADPGLYREQRKQIVSDWVYYVDGRSADRLADWIGQKALSA